MLIAFAVIPGCKDRSKETTDGEGSKEKQAAQELKEAGQHLKKAGEIVGEKAETTAQRFGNLLTEAWQDAREGAFDLKENLSEAYQRNLEEAKSRRDQWRNELGQGTSDALDALAEKIAVAEEKLAALREATEKNWEAARRAFNVAWEELRDALQKSEAEFAKPPEEREENK